MFEHLIVNLYEKVLKKEAISNIRDNDKKYKKFLDFLENEVSEKKLIVSNYDIVINDTDAYVRDLSIFVRDPLDYAKDITIRLCTKFPNKVMTKIFEYDTYCEIHVNLRKLLTVNGIKNFKYLNIYKAISSNAVVYNDKTYVIMPYMLKLINEYKILYDPSQSRLWKKTYERLGDLERITRSFIIESVKRYKYEPDIEDASIVNLSYFNDPKKPRKLKGEKLHKHVPAQDGFIVTYDPFERSKVFNKLRELMVKYLTNDYYILINESAYFIHKNEKVVKKLLELRYIDAITKLSIVEERSKLQKYLSKFIGGIILIKPKDLYVSNERRCEKYTMVLQIGKNEYHLVNFYNNMTYELINYEDHKIPGYGNIRIADPIILIRFLYICIWNMIMITKVVRVTEKQHAVYINKQVEMINYFYIYVYIYIKRVKYDGYFTDVLYNRKTTILNGDITIKPVLYCNDLWEYIPTEARLAEINGVGFDEENSDEDNSDKDNSDEDNSDEDNSDKDIKSE